VGDALRRRLITANTAGEFVPQERGRTEKQEKENGQEMETPENRYGCHESPPGEFDILSLRETVRPYQFFAVQRLLNGGGCAGCNSKNVDN
jgi:hypothetical protein